MKHRQTYLLVNLLSESIIEIDDRVDRGKVSIRFLIRLEFSLKYLHEPLERELVDVLNSI